MNKNIENRENIINFLTEELVGPYTKGKERDFDQEISLIYKETYGPWKQLSNKEEVIKAERPTKRYGVGVLFPNKLGFDSELVTPDSNLMELSNVSHDNSDTNTVSQPILLEEDPEDSRTNLQSNSFFPSSMGISFLTNIENENDILKIHFMGGVYKPKKIHIKDQGRYEDWWLREPITKDYEFSGSDVRKSVVGESIIKVDEFDDLKLRLNIRSRKYKNDLLVTITFINDSVFMSGNTDNFNQRDMISIFQSSFSIEIISNNPKICFLEYPAMYDSSNDTEKQTLEMLYNEFPTFATGHNCSPTWDLKRSFVKELRVSPIPEFELPALTPNILDEADSKIEISMWDMYQGNFDSIKELFKLYSDWIENKKKEKSNMLERFQHLASENINKAQKCLDRMKKGLEFLNSNSQALCAFKLANQAMLIQREIQISDNRLFLEQESSDGDLRFEGSVPKVDNINDFSGKWRPFQIAFILMSLESTANKYSDEREIVDLIWFPTGGGKTEAYLGLSAFSIFMRRLDNPDDLGTDVLTRYTLRMLTTQQFQRTAALILAMEHIRKSLLDTINLGNKPIKIGLWIGGSVTPNTNKQAISRWKELKSNTRNVKNPFLLLNCPWCKAELGFKFKGKIFGYDQYNDQVIFKCQDKLCPFFNEDIPVSVVDEQIYSNPPDFLIATIDKFAQIPWNENIRHIFGIDNNGNRETSPPNLIIQDELHLISGPLGSVAGFYETLIEDFLTDVRMENPYKPKIISSTATIRRSKEQIKNLYARDEIMLFPPSGISAYDSFFAKVDSEASGKKFIGLIPSSFSQQEFQSRVYAALLQSSHEMTDSEKDPWHTILCFFSSLKELQTTQTLMSSDVIAHQRRMFKRGTITSERNIFPPTNLTSKTNNADIPDIMNKLQISTDSGMRALDVCLASNIIEVGVDIDRLSLMTIAGQPKTTSQYIQVSGRIGRKFKERPGLVCILFSPTGSRDRSHFESFQTYHASLYAQVEPTSVTPFSRQTVDRCLAGLIVGYIRQKSDKNILPSDFSKYQTLLDELRDKLVYRLELVDDSEKDYIISQFNKLFDSIKTEDRRVWGKPENTITDSESDNLMAKADAHIPPNLENKFWRVITSFRAVDSESQLSSPKDTFEIQSENQGIS